MEIAEDRSKQWPALKISFYEMMIKQLLDDDLKPEAEALIKATGLAPGASDLFKIYTDFYDTRKATTWRPLEAVPVPPIGEDECTLSLAPTQVTNRTIETRLKHLAMGKGACKAVAFAADGQYVAASFEDGIRVFDAAKLRDKTHNYLTDTSGLVTNTYNEHQGQALAVGFHPRLPYFYSAGTDRSLKMYNLTATSTSLGAKRAMSVISDSHPIRTFEIHPCGDFVFVGTDHHVVRLYDMNSQQCFATSTPSDSHSGAINALHCTSDGKNLATASEDGVVKIWDAVSNRCWNNLPTAHGAHGVHTVRWSRSLTYLLTSGADGCARLWDVRQGKEVQRFGHSGTSIISTASFSYGERYVIFATQSHENGEVTLYDAKTGHLALKRVGGHMGVVRAVGSSPVHQSFASCCEDGKFRYFELLC